MKRYPLIDRYTPLISKVELPIIEYICLDSTLGIIPNSSNFNEIFKKYEKQLEAQKKDEEKKKLDAIKSIKMVI
jgi:hypothetical protein